MFDIKVKIENVLSLDYHNNLVVLFVAGLVNHAVRLHKMAAT